MRQYQSKQELLDAIQLSYSRYIAEFATIPEKLKDTGCDEVDRTSAQNLAYQLGWTNLLIKWEQDEKAGLTVKTPSDKFKWNQLSQLYEWFNEEYSQLSLAELETKLTQNVQTICQLIAAMTEQELFEPHQRQWTDDATKTAVWEIAKFIHINTVAPFRTFRTRIRRWKKLML